MKKLFILLAAVLTTASMMAEMDYQQASHKICPYGL